jgi:putative phage-type endonuclease
MLKEQTVEEWREERRKGVGGSDVAGILGISKYSTPYTVWADKLGFTPHKEDTPAMRMGRDLEPYVARRFTEETGLVVRCHNEAIRNPAFPYSFAHIDRRIDRTKSGGLIAGLECKTCTPYLSSNFSDSEYPKEYHAQVLHYLGVTGWDTWYIAVLILDGTLRVYEVQRKDFQSEIDEIQKAVTNFWEGFVLTGIKPPIDGKEPTTDAIKAMYSGAVDNCVNLEHLEPHFVEQAILDGQIKELQEERDRHLNELKSAIGTSTHAECGAWEISYKPDKNGKRIFRVKLSA